MIAVLVVSRSACVLFSLCSVTCFRGQVRISVLGVRDVVGEREGADHQEHAKTAHYWCLREGGQRNTPIQVCFLCFRAER